MALACLVTTDLVVGLVVQPLEIENFGLILRGGETRNMLCAVANVTKTVSATCISASPFHVLLFSDKTALLCNTGLVSYRHGLCFGVDVCSYPLCHRDEHLLINKSFAHLCSYLYSN